MPRQAIRQMPNNETKTDIQTIGRVAYNSNRTRSKCTEQKKPQKLSNAVPNDRGDGEPRKATQKHKADTSKSNQKQDDVEEIVLAIGQQKPKKTNRRITGRHYHTKQKTKEMLHEVNLLLAMDKFNSNANTSKSYLRSIQKTLNSSLKNRDFSKNGPGIDPEVLSLVHEPIKMTHFYLLNKQNRNPMLNSRESLTAITEIEEYTNNLSEGSRNLTLQIEPKRAESSQDIGNVERETNVKSLLTFWNDKLSNKVDILCSCLHNPQKCSSKVVKPKNVVQLSSDGVDEEHTIKPSDIKVGKGPPGIAELLTLNSKNIIRKIKSRKNITASSDKDNLVRTIAKKDQVISQLQQNKTFNKTKSKDSTIEARPKKPSSSTQKSTQKSSKPKLKKRNVPKINNCYILGEVKKETVSSASYSYMYIVNYLVEYAKVFRSKPKSASTEVSESVNVSITEKSERSACVSECKQYRTAESDGTNEFTISIEKITIITGIKAGILQPLLQVMNKKILPGNLCKLTRAELKKLRQIGNQLTTTDSSFKGKLLYYLFDIEKKFNFYKECIKIAYLKAMYYVPKISLLHEMKHYEAMDLISFHRHRLYFTVALIMVVFCLVILLLASSI